MYPHVITIFRLIKKDGLETYYRKQVDNVYWYGNVGITVSGKGLVDSDSINVFIPKESLTGYDTEWSINKKDRIVKGIAKDINSFNELEQYEDVIIVKKINKNDCGSELDNILVTGE